MGGGKRYVHYVTIRAAEVTGSRYGWAVYVAPIVNDISTPFTLDTLNTWASNWGNHNMTAEVTGPAASGYYNDKEVFGICFSVSGGVGTIIKQSNGFFRGAIPADEAYINDKVFEI